MWKNRHVVAALLIAPILAIIAWFAVDRVVGESPHAARPGAAYALVARPSCRYASGNCTLVNGDFQVELALRDGELVLTAAHPLDAAAVAAGSGDAFPEPRAMRALDADRRRWRVDMPAVSPDGSVRLVLTASGSRYFGEAALAFTAGR